MNLQFGSEKCIRMHIGKDHNKNICSDITVDAWKEQVNKYESGRRVKMDKYVGKELMENVNEKVYLGDNKILNQEMTNPMEILIKLYEHFKKGH